VVKIKRKEFVRPGGKKIDEPAAVQERFRIQVHNLCDAMSSQAGFQLGQRVVDDQSSRHGHGEPFFSLMKFPGEGLGRDGVAKKEAFMWFRPEISRGFWLSPTGNITMHF